jgi:hypothetical protein
MPLFPHATLLIESPLPVERAAARLQEATGPRTLFRFGPRPPQPFAGEVTGSEVRIERAIGYQNSFLPRIRAHLEPRAGGCRLVGSMSLHPLVAVFLVVWVAFLLMMGLPALLWLARGEPSPQAWTFLGMLAFAWVLSAGAFTVEARLAHRKLAALLDAASQAR